MSVPENPTPLDEKGEPMATAATDPVPAPVITSSARKLARLAAEAQAKAEPARKAPPAEPDPELAQLAAVARATCGCEACGRLERKQANGSRTVLRGGDRPGSCGFAVILEALIARGDQKAQAPS